MSSLNNKNVKSDCMRQDTNTCPMHLCARFNIIQIFLYLVNFSEITKSYMKYLVCTSIQACIITQFTYVTTGYEKCTGLIFLYFGLMYNIDSIRIKHMEFLILPAFCLYTLISFLTLCPVNSCCLLVSQTVSVFPHTSIQPVKYLLLFHAYC